MLQRSRQPLFFSHRPVCCWLCAVGTVAVVGSSGTGVLPRPALRVTSSSPPGLCNRRSLRAVATKGVAKAAGPRLTGAVFSAGPGGDGMLQSSQARRHSACRVQRHLNRCAIIRPASMIGPVARVVFNEKLQSIKQHLACERAKNRSALPRRHTIHPVTSLKYHRVVSHQQLAIARPLRASRRDHRPSPWWHRNAKPQTAYAALLDMFHAKPEHFTQEYGAEWQQEWGYDPGHAAAGAAPGPAPTYTSSEQHHRKRKVCAHLMSVSLRVGRGTSSASPPRTAGRARAFCRRLAAWLLPGPHSARARPLLL
jgi:hypothetical protein